MKKGKSKISVETFFWPIFYLNGESRFFAIRMLNIISGKKDAENENLDGLNNPKLWLVNKYQQQKRAQPQFHELKKMELSWRKLNEKN